MATIADVVELWSDPRRKLRVDPSGREMLISCGAALFGLRLAVRSLGYLIRASCAVWEIAADHRSRRRGAGNRGTWKH